MHSSKLVAAPLESFYPDAFNSSPSRLVDSGEDMSKRGPTFVSINALLLPTRLRGVIRDIQQPNRYPFDAINRFATAAAKERHVYVANCVYYTHTTRSLGIHVIHIPTYLRD